MKFIEQISSMQLDILKEIGNIGAGNAATALSSVLNKKVNMKVPNVRIISFDDMMNMAGGAENVVASVFFRIEGEAPGCMFFVLPIEQASNYTKALIGDENFSYESPPYSELGLSALQELGNILAGSYLSALSDFTNLSLFPSVPALSIDMFGAIISFGLIKLSHVGDYAIVIDTALNEDEDTDTEYVKGHFFLLPDPESFQTIFQSLGVLE